MNPYQPTIDLAPKGKLKQTVATLVYWLVISCMWVIGVGIVLMTVAGCVLWVHENGIAAAMVQVAWGSGMLFGGIATIIAIGGICSGIGHWFGELAFQASLTLVLLSIVAVGIAALAVAYWSDPAEFMWCVAIGVVALVALATAGWLLNWADEERTREAYRVQIASAETNPLCLPLE